MAAHVKILAEYSGIEIENILINEPDNDNELPIEIEVDFNDRTIYLDLEGVELLLDFLNVQATAMRNINRLTKR